jgi:fructoselysine 6-kinase
MWYNYYMNRIACFSVACMDTFTHNNKQYPGGNALNQAIRFQDLGVATAFVGALGTDSPGEVIKTTLTAHKIDMSHTYILPGITACNRIYNDDNGERFGEPGAWQNGVYGEFRLQAVDWDFLATFPVWATHANCPDFSVALGKKQAKQMLVVDFLHLADYQLLASSIPYIDIAYIGGTIAMAESLANLAKTSNKLIILTLGASGSMAFSQGQVFHQSALPARVIDTTGCGDAFQAACTAKYINGGTIQDCLAAGAAAGQSACQYFGALGDIVAKRSF